MTREAGERLAEGQGPCVEQQDDTAPSRRFGKLARREIATLALLRYDRGMTYIAVLLWITAFITGLLMFLLCAGDKKRIGEMLLFSAIGSLLIAAAPAVIKFLH